MSAENPEELTQLLHRSQDDPEAREHVYRMVYADLHAFARGQLRGAGAQTLSATALVNEAYLKLVRRTGGAWNDRTHFFRLAARAMRQITVDHARARLAAKRGGDQVVEPLHGNELGGSKPEMVVALEEGLEELRRNNPALVDVVECRFFAGYTEDETASTLGLSTRTVQRHWQQAREWLRTWLTV